MNEANSSPVHSPRHDPRCGYPERRGELDATAVPGMAQPTGTRREPLPGSAPRTLAAAGAHAGPAAPAANTTTGAPPGSAASPGAGAVLPLPAPGGDSGRSAQDGAAVGDSPDDTAQGDATAAIPTAPAVSRHPARGASRPGRDQLSGPGRAATAHGFGLCFSSRRPHGFPSHPPGLPRHSAARSDVHPQRLLRPTGGAQTPPNRTAGCPVQRPHPADRHGRHLLHQQSAGFHDRLHRLQERGLEGPDRRRNTPSRRGTEK